MIAESRLVAGLMLIKITAVKQRVSHVLPLIAGQCTLRKELRKVSLREQHFFLSGNSACVLTVNDRLLMGSQEVSNIGFLQSIMQNFIVCLNILSGESFVNAVDLSSRHITHEHSSNSGFLFIREIVLREEAGKLDTAVKARLCFKHIREFAVFTVAFSRSLGDICLNKRKHLTKLSIVITLIKEVSKIKLHILDCKTVNNGRKSDILLHRQTEVSHFAEHICLTDSVLQCSMESRSVLLIHCKSDLAVTDNSMIAHTCFKERLDLLELLRGELAHIIMSVTVRTIVTVADFLRLIGTCKLLTHIHDFVPDVANCKEISVTNRQRTLAGRIDSARKLHTTGFHDLSHFQHKVTVSGEVLLLRDITILRTTEDVFFGRRVRSVGFGGNKVGSACDTLEPLHIFVIDRHNDGIITGIGIVVDARSVKLFLQSCKIRSLDRHKALVSVICCFVPHFVAVSLHICLLNLLFVSLVFYCFWDTTKHIIPVFICIGSDNTLHVGILLLQTLGKIIACGIIVGA